ncbi:MAG: amidohydrolase [Phycisphaerales bacterium]
MSTAAHPALGRLRELVAQELPRVVALRHDLHMHPEIAYEEHRTAGVVVRELTDAGIAHVAGMAGGTGVLGHLAGRAPRATALRADMDALPIVEETGAPYASTIPGRMHACGHDGHTAILLGAARVLARAAQEAPLPRPVTLVFQPAEEGGAGGKRMVDEGALDGSRLGPPADSAFGLHGWPDLPLGQVSTRPGPMLAASDRFEIHIEGRGAHAAYPHTGVDPVCCAGAMLQSLHAIVSRSVDPLDSAVVSVTVVQAGTAFNIIPPHATLRGTLRSLRESTRCLLEERVAAVAHGIAAAHGCTARCEITRSYPVTENDPGAVAAFETIARDALGAAQVPPLPHPVMGGEDFAFYGQRVPACFFALGLAPAGRTWPTLHAPTFDFNDDALGVGIEMMCRLALRPV